ncbi:hypothetical protein IscW_ISCW005376 [Ixodes scapularis]|uniref:Uncharacterized protein n=1 Tax=Ixodes scapularis TaxID=6945 RepID=B7PL44_IXOSC|nr:hypothetical protein IscW_ISCW005376 [Ixodes scapularis]|eukprot:XP_002434492.1 hypothetical protein IscW_ISCW005376 [Ixodes scapularis]
MHDAFQHIAQNIEKVECFGRPWWWSGESNVGTCVPRSEYIFTAPGYVSPGTTTKFYAVVRNPKSAGTLDVELWDRTSQPGRTDTKLASKTYQFENKGEARRD